jgi:uncharacterized protein (DUF1697 family)
MKYVVLLRGVNVGGKRKVEMGRLRNLLEASGFQKIQTYLNSGNIIFESEKALAQLQKEMAKLLEKEFSFSIPFLIKTSEEMRQVASSIPETWHNNSDEKTDVAYLFPEISEKDVLAELPWDTDYIELCMAPGVIVWHIERENLNRSRLSKIVGHQVYQLMTVRNVNTARRLAGM